VQSRVQQTTVGTGVNARHQVLTLTREQSASRRFDQLEATPPLPPKYQARCWSTCYSVLVSIV